MRNERGMKGLAKRFQRTVCAVRALSLAGVVACQQPAFVRAQDRVESPPPDRAKELRAYSLEEVMAFAVSSSEVVQETKAEMQAIESEIKGRDIVLSPRLSSELYDARDERQSVSNAPQTPRSRFFDVTLSQLFSGGTTLALGVSHEDLERPELGSRDIGSWEVRATQALWRDAFGRGTSLRHEAERAELRVQTLNSIAERQGFFVRIESAYWDLALAFREERIRRANIERGKVVESWIRERIRRSAAETADLLQAQALLRARQLQLLDVQDRIQELRDLIVQLIPSPQLADWEPELELLEKPRSLSALMINLEQSEETIAAPQHVASLATEYGARQAALEALRAHENQKPRLDAYISHGRNGVDESFATAWNEAMGADFTSTRVGVLFAMDLDRGLTDQIERAARLRAETQGLVALRRQRESDIAWRNLSRRSRLLGEQIESARALADLQRRKVEAERRLFRLGRSTVFQLITFEVESSEADLQVYQLLAELRKLESGARLFVASSGVSLK